MAGKPKKKAVLRPFFELFVDEHISTEATMPVRWCLSPAGREHLHQLGVLSEAMVLLVVTSVRRDPKERWKDTWKETKRYLIPLTQEMATISFSRSGENILYGAIVWPRGSSSRFHQRILDKGPSGYTSDFVYREWNSDSFVFGEYHSGVSGLFEHQAKVTINVDKAFFAKPMSKFRKAILGKWGKGRRFDECDARKNMIWAVPLTFITLPIAFIAKVVGAIVMGGAGLFRGIKWSSLWHPMERSSLEFMFEDVHDPLWFRKKNKEPHVQYPEFVWRKWPMIVWNPYTVFLGGLILFAISNIHVTRGDAVVDFLGWGWWYCVGLSAIVPLALIALLLAVMGIAKAFVWIADRLNFGDSLDRFASWLDAFEERRANKKATKVERALIAIECRVVEAVDFDHIDRKSKTLPEKIRLWRDKKKLKRCRPYEQE